MTDLIEAARVDSFLEDLAESMPTEEVALESASGRVLREPIVADRDLPPFDRVMMDGYAIRHTDLKTTNRFTVKGSAFAGRPRQTLPSDTGAALEVMTGSPLPEQADCVIPFEATLREKDTFHLCGDPQPEPGQFIHRRGSDFPAGTCLVKAGSVLRSIETGIAASCGLERIEVSRQPRLAIFGTGDELVPVAATPAPHQIRRSNAQALASLLARAHGLCPSVDHLADNPKGERSKLEAATRSADVLILSGAVSKGRLDWIPPVLDDLGTCLFHGVSQRPGKPMGVWKASTGAVIFALPGNPVSTLVCAHRYVLPFLKRLFGLNPQTAPVRLLQPFAFARPLTLFLPVRRSGTDGAIPCPVNNSGDFASLAGTDGFVELASNENHWTTGTELHFTPWI